MRVIYPGSFDPPTKGHVDIAKRAARMFGDVIVLVIPNTSKNSCLSKEARVLLMHRCLEGVEGIRVCTEDGLLIDAIKKYRASAIVRGLRDSPDYLAEKPVADAFLRMFGVETLFVQCDPSYTYISSTLARQMLQLNGPADNLIPSCILRDVLDAYSIPYHDKGKGRKS